MLQPTHMLSGKDVPLAGGVYAALDLGTNNCRLLVASLEKKAGALVPNIIAHDSFSRIVKLGEGVTTSGLLLDEAMERTLVALKICQKKLTRFELSKSRFVATEACRRAANSRDFLKKIEAETGFVIEIINTEEEAKLAFLGCSSLLPDNCKQAIVFDIGGGSTELLWVNRNSGNEHDIAQWLSVEYGVMNLADKFGGSLFIDRVYADMVSYIKTRLEPLTENEQLIKALSEGGLQFLSTSGTVTTIAAIYMNLPRYERSRVDGVTLKVSELASVIPNLLSMRPSQRFNHPCIGHERADFIISGCAIFEAITSIWPHGIITIADRGVREGIILSLARGDL